jgi:hypothetical protein
MAKQELSRSSEALYFVVQWTNFDEEPVQGSFSGYHKKVEPVGCLCGSQAPSVAE